MAPELWTKPAKYSIKSDVWALGVILYELCCLEYPFPAATQEELEQKVINDPIRPHPNHVTKDFVDFFSKMLRKDPARRPCCQQIIYSDVFQDMAKKNKVLLPTQYNKDKLQTLASTGKLSEVTLTDR